MTKFLDKKEQVYDLELTSYGRYLLSIGTFKPTYYTFLDDNIVYDIKYTSTASADPYMPFEGQSNINKRIKEEGFLEDQQREIDDGVENITCAAVNKDGGRCGIKIEEGSNYCTIHQKVEQREGEKVQCKKIKSDGDRCKMKTSAKSGLCYYHD